MGLFLFVLPVFLHACLCFPLSTYVTHAVSENHFKLGTWAQDTEKLWGLCPQTPNQDVGWSQWRDGSAVSFLQAANAALVRLT